jgi:hypothetical protein
MANILAVPLLSFFIIDITSILVVSDIDDGKTVS